MGHRMSAIVEVDARRLLCPMPVIRLQDCIDKQPAGASVRITCTDPGTMNDIPSWCRINGHSVVSCEEQQDEYIFLVRKDSDGKS
jgi:tRNA 2-thiouridine synthesizing protein A